MDITTPSQELYELLYSINKADSTELADIMCSSSIFLHLQPQDQDGKEKRPSNTDNKNEFSEVVDIPLPMSLYTTPPQHSSPARVTITAKKSAQLKCPRCWRYFGQVAQDGLCSRCAAVCR